MNINKADTSNKDYIDLGLSLYSVFLLRIASCVRGFLCRKRAREYKQGLKEWRRIRCGHVAKVFDVMVSLHVVDKIVQH